mmetsp:Transcript_142810/g.397806  ORF Transcript_142810/g.397806 Transcript_142810/m.397806 type:complete len:204 (-) Transcript_142810:88-699(-)
MEEGRSGNQVPPQYGEPGPYYVKAARVSLPAALAGLLLGALAAWAGGVWLAACRVAQLLGAAFAFGSNAWLMVYGPKMYTVCTSTQWLGKEGFSTIQAALFPDFFAFQTASCVIALGAYIGVSQTVDTAAITISASLVFCLINLAFLGPKTNALMVELYKTPMMDDAGKAVKKKFGMVHGISMLVDLFALGFATVFLGLLALK